MSDYDAFLQAKIQLARSSGFEIDASEVNPLLKPFQVATVLWAVDGGCRVELSKSYFLDGAEYCKAAEQEMSMPSLFDVLEAEEAAP